MDGSSKERDGYHPMDDSVEFWLKFPEQDDFYQFMINGIGNIYDRKGRNVKWNCSDIKVSSKIAGDQWILECSIPWKNFPFKVQPGNKFRFDFCRSYMRSNLFTSSGSGAHAQGG